MTLKSVRLPESLVSKLKHRALTESLRRGAQVSWACLLREAAEQLLRQDVGQGDVNFEPNGN